MRTAIFYAVERESISPPGAFYANIYASAFPTHLSSSDRPLCKLRLTETLFDDAPDEAYWAWWEFETATFKFVYHARILLNMVFPMGIKGAVEQNRGEVVRVRVEELGTFTPEEAKAQEWKP